MLTLPIALKNITNKTTLILTFLTLGLFWLSLTPVWANMGPPPPQGDNSGLAFIQNEDIEVTSQVLNISFLSDMTFDIEAIYTMHNITNSAIAIDAMFVSPIYHNNDLREYQILIGNTALDYSTRLIKFEDRDRLPTNWYQNLNDAIEILSTSEIEYWEVGYNLVTFTLEFASNETLLINFGYNYQPNIDSMWSHNYTRATLWYLLSPASFWADYGNLEINVTLFAGHIMNSTLDFTQISRRNYQFTATTLPSGDLRINVSTMPTGFAFIRNGNIFLYILSIVIYVLLGGLLIFLPILIFVKAKRQNRSLISSFFGTLSVLSFIMSMLILAFIFTSWIHGGFYWPHLIFGLFSIGIFIISLIFGLIYFVCIKVSKNNNDYVNPHL